MYTARVVCVLTFKLYSGIPEILSWAWTKAPFTKLSKSAPRRAAIWLQRSVVFCVAFLTWTFSPITLVHFYLPKIIADYLHKTRGGGFLWRSRNLFEKGKWSSFIFFFSYLPLESAFQESSKEACSVHTLVPTFLVASSSPIYLHNSLECTCMMIWRRKSFRDFVNQCLCFHSEAEKSLLTQASIQTLSFTVMTFYTQLLELMNGSTNTQMKKLHHSGANDSLLWTKSFVKQPGQMWHHLSW